MIKSNYSLLKCDQESILEFRLYALVALMIMIKLITMFISLLTTQNLTSINCTSTQKTSWAFSQNKFEAEVYYTLNWWLSDWENCWYVNENFLIIHSRSESTLSYFCWARLLFHDESSLYFICQNFRHIFLFVKKASAYCVQSQKCEWNQLCYLQNLSFTTSYNELIKSFSRIHSIFCCSWSQYSR